MGDSLHKSKKSSSSTASGSRAPTTIKEHPLDPEDSFVHIEDSSKPATSSKPTSKKKSSKDPNALSLEDGWDFVEEIDDSPPSNPSPLTTKTEEKKKSKHEKGSSSTSLQSSSKSSRSSASMPPPAAHTTTKQERANMMHVTGSPPEEVTIRRSRHGATNSNAKRPNTELAANSGFKHRIYCTLYNLYHAQPSEAPSLAASPIYMMGAVITPNSDSASSSPTFSLSSSSSAIPSKESKSKSKYNDSKRTTKDDFLELCRTLHFFSYRKDFARLEGYQVTSDVGWGCMLRTGQMLLASALQRLYEPIVCGRQSFGTTYDRSKLRVPIGQELITPSNAPIIARHILDWFRDSPDLDKHPYSIHNLVRTSRIQNATANEHLALVAENTAAPSWFSPTKLSRVLRFLVRMHAPEHLTMYVPPDGVLYVDEIVALCKDPQTSTLSPVPSHAHEDRTFLWWKRFSANGPSVSRSLTLPDYSGSDDDELRVSEESNGSIDRENIESDALYQRALAESMAQYEAENTPNSVVSSPSGGSIPSSDSSRPISPQRLPPHAASLVGDSSLLEWSAKDWDAGMDSASAPATRVAMRVPVVEQRPASTLAVPRAKPKQFIDGNNTLNEHGEISWTVQQTTQHNQQTSAAGEESLLFSGERRFSDASDGAQPSSVVENGKFFPRPSTESTGSIEASSTWVHLPIIRSDFGVIAGTSSGLEGGDDSSLDDYFVSPGMSSGPLNLSSWVENHEKLTGAPKPVKYPKKTQETSLSPRANLSPRPASINVATSHSASLNTTTPSSAPSTATMGASPVSLDLSYATSISTTAETQGTKLPSPYSSIGTDQFKALGGSDDSSSGPISPSRGVRPLEDSVFSFAPPSAPASTTAGIPKSMPLPQTTVTQERMGYSLNSAPNPTKNPATPTAPTDIWRPLLLLIPSRLGVSKVNPAYIEHLKMSLSSASSVGVVGGKPNRSLYFFAFQDDYVFYLDPHYVHSASKPLDGHGNVHDSFKVRFPQKMKLLDLDPSLALGFFLRSRADFEAFCQAHHSFAIQAQDDPSTEPIFTIQASAPDYLKR